MDSDNKQSATAAPGLAQEELEAARKIIASLLLTRKNYSLYPEGHTICTNSFERFHAMLSAYLKKNGSLKLDIEKDRIVSQDDVIHTEPPEEGSLPYTLFRDGIKWLEFIDGIEASELKEFVRIINKYSILSDESDGDIVTAFWENQFTHIKYENADLFWGVDQETEFRTSSDMDEKSSAPLREVRLADWEPLPDPIIDPSAIVLTMDDHAKIKELIHREEEGDPTAYLDALLDSLLQHREKENFEIILEVLEEEFKNALLRRDFDISLKLLQSLQYITESSNTDMNWAGAYIENFILTISSSRCLSPLLDIWQHIEPDQIAKLRLIFTLLQPEAIHTLGAILSQNQPVQLRQMIIDVITSLASRDFGPLETLLKDPDEKLIEKLVQVLVKLEGEQSLKMLMKLVRHTSSRVRQEAVKGLLQRGPASTKDIFALIGDKDESLRRLILKQMGQSRNHTAEDFLLDYLGNREFKSSDSDHVIACFTVLGQCGSSRSIPFLRRTLFDNGWLSAFAVSAHREGAAIALSKLGIKEAQQVLEEARRSLCPSVRRTARKIK